MIISTAAKIGKEVAKGPLGVAETAINLAGSVPERLPDLDLGERLRRIDVGQLAEKLPRVDPADLQALAARLPVDVESLTGRGREAAGSAGATSADKGGWRRLAVPLGVAAAAFAVALVVRSLRSSRPADPFEPTSAVPASGDRAATPDNPQFL